MRMLSMSVRVVRLVRRVIRRNHVHFGRRNSAAHHLAHLQPRAHIQRRSRLLQMSEGHTRVNQRAQQHIAAYAGKTFQISNSHRQ